MQLSQRLFFRLRQIALNVFLRRNQPLIEKKTNRKIKKLAAKYKTCRQLPLY